MKYERGLSGNDFPDTSTPQERNKIKKKYAPPHIHIQVLMQDCTHVFTQVSILSADWSSSLRVHNIIQDFQFVEFIASVAFVTIA